MAKCIPKNSCLPFLMRFFLVMEFLIGALFIVFGIVLQAPPTTAVPIGLVVLGALTVINSLFGCVGSCYFRSLLTVYLVIGTILTAGQAVLVFYIFGNTNKVASQISGYNGTNTALDGAVTVGDFNSVKKDLNIAKWVLLVFICCEIVSLIVAFIMRCCVDPEGHYNNFNDEEARYNTQMNQMPAAGAGGAAYDSAKTGIASKYGMYKAGG